MSSQIALPLLSRSHASSLTFTQPLYITLISFSSQWYSPLEQIAPDVTTAQTAKTVLNVIIALAVMAAKDAQTAQTVLIA